MTKIKLKITTEVTLTDEEFARLNPPYDPRRRGNPYDSMEAPEWVKERIDLSNATCLITADSFYTTAIGRF